MSTQRFTPEFKEEAVKQVTELGYSVAEVSARLGVSSHSLYKWVKAIMSWSNFFGHSDRVFCSSSPLVSVG